MDIFNRKKVAELSRALSETEKKLLEAERDRDKYRTEANVLADKFAEASYLNDHMPEGCVKGSWCKACEFAREISYMEYLDPYSGYQVTTNYACVKGKSCENFIQKEV